MEGNSLRMSLRGVMAFLFLITGAVSAAQTPPPDQGPANVAGKWTIYSKGDDGKTDTKFVELEQDGGTLKGHFKGPNQSGGVEGTVDGKHVVFRTKTRNVMTFRGMVDNEGMHGRWGIFVPKRGLMHGDWQARRQE